MTILLVDTNQQALDREARRLSKRQSGIVVMFYSNAEDAESFARTHDVDIVYTREKLLGTTGMELIKKILRFRPTAECHVLQNNEEIPFARFSEDDPAYLESDEENTVFPRREDHSVIGLLLNKIETKSFGRHFTMDSWKREEEETMSEQSLRGLSRRQLLELMIQQGKEMESRKAAYEKDLAFMKSEHQRDLDFLKSEHEKETAQLKKDLEQANHSLEAREQVLHEAGAKELETCKAEYEERIARMVGEHEEEREGLREEVAQLKKALSEQQVSTQEAKTADSEQSREEYQVNLQLLKAQYDRDLEALKLKQERETAQLREDLAQAKKALESRQIALNEAGSIAVAALQINGVFEAAQAASQQYIENIRSLSDRQAAICAQRDMENRVEVERKLKEAEEKCAAMEYASKRKCEAMEQEAKQKSEAYWGEVSKRLQSFYENHQEIKRLLDYGSPSTHL